jgi:hypothetical protein
MSKILRLLIPLPQKNARDFEFDPNFEIPPNLVTLHNDRNVINAYEEHRYVECRN